MSEKIRQIIETIEKVNTFELIEEFGFLKKYIKDLEIDLNWTNKILLGKLPYFEEYNFKIPDEDKEFYQKNKDHVEKWLPCLRLRFVIIEEELKARCLQLDIYKAKEKEFIHSHYHHSKLDKLPESLRDDLRQMLIYGKYPFDYKGDKTVKPKYKDMRDYCCQKGHKISLSALGRFGREHLLEYRLRGKSDAGKN